MNGFSTGEDDSVGIPDQICCLVDSSERCKRPAGNASYSKRIQKTVTQRKLKLHIDNLARHIYICDYHKGVIQSARTRRRRKDSDEDMNDHDFDTPEIDLCHLQLNTLRRFKRHFKLQTKQGLNKTQLAESLVKHLKTMPVVEKEILTFFIYMVRSNSNKLDQKYGIGENT